MNTYLRKGVVQPGPLPRGPSGCRTYKKKEYYSWANKLPLDSLPDSWLCCFISFFFCCCNCGFRHGADRGCWKTQSLVEPSGPRAERLKRETQNTQNFHHFFNSARWTTIQNQQRFFSFILRLLNYWLVVLGFFLPSFFFLFFFYEAKHSRSSRGKERDESLAVSPCGQERSPYLTPRSLLRLSHVCRGSLRRQIIALWMGPRGIFGFGFERSIPCSCYFYLRQYGRQPVSSLLTVGCHWCLGGPERKACRARTVCNDMLVIVSNHVPPVQSVAFSSAVAAKRPRFFNAFRKHFDCIDHISHVHCSSDYHDFAQYTFYLVYLSRY